MSKPTHGLDREALLRIARDAQSVPATSTGFFPLSENQLQRFAHLVIEDFLIRSGQYLTNDVTREAAIAEAVAAERQAIIATCRAKADEWQQRPGRWQHHQGAAIGALACAELVEKRGRT